MHNQPERMERRKSPLKNISLTLVLTPAVGVFFNYFYFIVAASSLQKSLKPSANLILVSFMPPPTPPPPSQPPGEDRSCSFDSSRAKMSKTHKYCPNTCPSKYLPADWRSRVTSPRFTWNQRMFLLFCTWFDGWAALLYSNLNLKYFFFKYWLNIYLIFFFSCTFE